MFVVIGSFVCWTRAVSDGSGVAYAAVYGFEARHLRMHLHTRAGLGLVLRDVGVIATDMAYGSPLAPC